MATAKQDMTSLDETVLSVLWKPESSQLVEFRDSAGELKVNASSNLMILEIADGGELHSTVFNDTIGQVAYVLPYSASFDTGIFIKGDTRSIVNQSGSGITQLSVNRGDQHPEIQLRYRPILSYASVGVEDGRTVNCLRLYVVTLNSSELSSLMGAVPLRVSCLATQTITTTYTLEHVNETAVVTCTLGQDIGQVDVPIESTGDGAVVQVEVVLCRVEIGRVIR